ncbi:MAG: hypothetical protein KJN80_09275 [Deltaproteobacteria bacterium]|nr:hypothetical protein [Deltaproteobacteria bacterium]
MDEIKIISHNLGYHILALLLILTVFFCSGCSSIDFRYFGYKDTILTQMVSVEQLPQYDKITVCQGPAILQLKSEALFGIVRCYDSNNDGEMLSLDNPGIDVFEYSLTVRQKNKNGHFHNLINKHPHVLIIDGDFDGIGDQVYIFRLISIDGNLIYRKLDIGSKKLVMNDFAPAYFRLSDFIGF